MNVPTSTYRLQLTARFTLFDAAQLVPYLAELGVGAVYISPILRATAGSTHGYDVVDHSMIDPERGGEAGLAALAEACSAAGLGLVLDTVPNHMGVTVPVENPAWWDVLRLGRASTYATWFDIDWSVANGRVLLPILGDEADLGRDLSVVGDELHYAEHRLPIAPGTGTGSAVEVHSRQHYELINYRRADTDQNYRRFFAVSGLAAVRVEDPDVYEATHRTLLAACREYRAVGIRIDHPDGLSDPAGYLRRLAADLPAAWIVVEKITQAGEALPPDWPVAGLTGYDALNDVCALLVDPGAEVVMTDLYRELTDDYRSFEEHAVAAKHLVATTILAAEVSRIARLAPELDAADARALLAELATAFPVYRSYLPLGLGHLDRAVASVRSSHPELSGALKALLPRLSNPREEVCVRFQQLTGAVMAKGVEDAALYRYTRFIAFNEVGSEPSRFGCGLDEFHRLQQHRIESAPAGMTTVSTHDTKRGEDLRARLAVLAEVPDAWHALASATMKAAPIHDAPLAYLLWQTAVVLAVDGLDEVVRTRLHDYLEKAMREAGTSTSWAAPDHEFEAAVHRAVDAVFDDAEVRAAVTAFAARIETFAWSNSLSQKLVQLTMPGVPDVYQGSEFWEDSLVDPDNRRPVDFANRRAALAVLDDAAGPPSDPELAKLWIVSRALRLRRDRPQAFTDYAPLRGTGSAADHLIAFDRGGAVTLATRLPAGLAAADGWGNTRIDLPPGRYVDAFTGRSWEGTCGVSEVLSGYPVALLIADPVR